MGEETRWRNGCVEFSEVGLLRTCAGTTVTPTGPVPVRPLLAPIDGESEPMEDGERGKDESVQEEAEEGKRPLFRKSENQPPSQEVQEHMKTHIPHRSWCAHCIRVMEEMILRRKERTEGSSSPRDQLQIPHNE